MMDQMHSRTREGRSADISASLADASHRAYRWVVDRADQYCVATGTGRSKMVATKRWAELATMAAAMTGVEADAERLISFAWEQIGHGSDILDAIEIEPAIAIAYLPFRRAGLRCSNVERWLAAPSWRKGHRSWSALAKYSVGFMLETIGVSPPWCQVSVLKQLRVFEDGGDWPYALRLAVMAHVVMWKTGMGTDWAVLDPEEMAKFDQRIDAWSARLIDDALFDPLAELIIANACLRRPPLVRAWRPILGAQRLDGSVPPRSGVTGFDETCHSTLVVALAATLSASAPSRVLVAGDSHIVFSCFAD
jgi:hypothetical protein